MDALLLHEVVVLVEFVEGKTYGKEKDYLYAKRIKPRIIHTKLKYNYDVSLFNSSQNYNNRVIEFSLRGLVAEQDFYFVQEEKYILGTNDYQTSMEIERYLKTTLSISDFEKCVSNFPIHHL